MSERGPRVAVVTFPGSLDDRDALRAVATMGGEPVPVWHADADLHGADAVILPGGFSYGDYLRTGAIARFAPAMRAVAAFAEAGGPVLGICNGFQILCEAGLLPGALIRNRNLSFVCRWINVRVEGRPPGSVESSGDLTIGLAGDVLAIPIKHGEGQFVAAEAELDRLEREGLVALRYCSPIGDVSDAYNPNGAARNIAGVWNERGNVLGLMPHPEHAVDPDLGPIGGQPILEWLLAAARARAGMTEALHRALGLTDDEFEAIVKRLDREPNRAELAMYSVMWSEHCSYKSSKVHLRTLPTEGPQVLVGPGQDAGVVDVGDGIACVFKMESHSHPSAIEPYQGAATGVGGIVRDVLSMGARPAALLDPLRFGPLEDPRNRFLFGGVVAGIGGYGNCIGVPTVGGEVKFAECHSANPTVNVMCVGFVPADALVQSRAGEPGSVLLLIGAATGRDGIGGVSVLASRTIEDDVHESRPSVQIGDPFLEKLLIEACLELKERGLLEGLKDLGGAGLTCAVSEAAAGVRLGADLDLDRVPLRESGMETFEILTSESQERMLAIVRPGDVAAAQEVCRKWGLEGSPVATFVDGGNLTVRRAGEVVAAVPALSLADEGPEYERPARRPDWLDALRADDPAAAPPPASLEQAFLSVLGSPNVAGKRWAFEQYDSLVQGQTVTGPGGDAAIIRIEGTLRAVAVSSDGNGRYGRLDPYLGAVHAVAESARNIAASGARPVAITNCLNFGNPERPEVMWQFAETIRGMADACRALDTPVTGGNVSFYNESGGSAIDPTAVIGMLGIFEDYRLMLRMGFPAEGVAIYALGSTLPELGGSEYAEVVLGKVSGVPPAVDLDAEARLHRLLVASARADVLASAHDCSGGGLSVTLAEAAIDGGVGFDVTAPAGGLAPHLWLFSESASRAVVTAPRGRERAFEELASAHGVPFERIGITGGDALRFAGLFEVSLADALVVHEGTIPRLMSARRAAVQL